MKGGRRGQTASRAQREMRAHVRLLQLQEPALFAACFNAASSTIAQPETCGTVARGLQGGVVNAVSMKNCAERTAAGGWGGQRTVTAGLLEECGAERVACEP